MVNIYVSEGTQYINEQLECSGYFCVGYPVTSQHEVCLSLYQGRRNGFGMGGGGLLHIKYKKDTVLFISIYVISNIH